MFMIPELGQLTVTSAPMIIQKLSGVYGQRLLAPPAIHCTIGLQPRQEFMSASSIVHGAHFETARKVHYEKKKRHHESIDE
jgi:hypothetical protein